MEDRQERVIAVSRWLQNSAYFLGIIFGVTRFHVDMHKQTIKSSRFITFYVLFLNIGIVVSLPILFCYFLAYITAIYKNNLLILADVLNVLIIFIAIAYSILSRFPREMAFIGILKEIFILDRAYFRAQSTCVLIQRRSNRMILLKMFTTLFQGIWPFVGTLQTSKKIDMEVVGLSFYLSFTIVMSYGVLCLYLLQMLEIRSRVFVLNAKLENMRRYLERMHRCTRGRQHHNCAALQQLATATARDLGELAEVHGRLTKLLVRLNDTFKCQVIAVVLSYMITKVTFSYFVYLALDGKVAAASSIFLWVANLLSIIFAFIDVNLLYWISQSTTLAFQDTARVLQSYRTLPLTNQKLERQCEQFAMQLLQQETDIRVGGMFTLNRQTSLAMVAFILRHTIILVQFDFETRLSSTISSITIETFVDMIRLSRV